MDAELQPKACVPTVSAIPPSLGNESFHRTLPEFLLTTSCLSCSPWARKYSATADCSIQFDWTRVSDRNRIVELNRTDCSRHFHPSMRQMTPNSTSKYCHPPGSVPYVLKGHCWLFGAGEDFLTRITLLSKFLSATVHPVELNGYINCLPALETPGGFVPVHATRT